MSYRLLFVWLGFGLLALGIIAHETTDIFVQKAPPKTGQLSMFEFVESDLERLELIFDGKSAFFQRDLDGNWFLHDKDHSHGTEHSSSDGKLHNHHEVQLQISSEIKKQIQITAGMKADQRIDTIYSDALDHRDAGNQNPQDPGSKPCAKNASDSPEAAQKSGCFSLDSFGLENPKIVFSFYSRGRNEADSLRLEEILYVGDLLPSEYTYYTRKDGESDVYLVPRYFIALLLALAFGSDQVPSVRPEN
jgi:hypothetical protein